jgi:SSS family transporter
MAITILIMAFPVVKYYLPFFRRLNVTTAYEYLEIRFNYAIRFLASFLFVIFMVARMALVLFLPSLALTTVTGIDIYICIILMGVITIIYCTMGGVEAVVWGDVIQGFVLLGGALLAVVFLISGTEGGLNTVIEISMDHDKFKMFDFAFDWTNATFWVVILGGLANNLISYTADQTVIQRYLTTKDEKSAARGIVLNGFLSVFVSIIFYSIGTALFAYYSTRPEEMNFSMANPDSIFPHFIMSEMPLGIAGLLIAAIFAATMSTVSSNVNSLSTAFTTDFYKHFFPKSSDRI